MYFLQNRLEQFLCHELDFFLTLISRSGIIEREPFLLQQCHYCSCSVQDRAKPFFVLPLHHAEEIKAGQGYGNLLTATGHSQYALRGNESWNKVVAGRRTNLITKGFFDLCFHKLNFTRLRERFYRNSFPTCQH